MYINKYLLSQKHKKTTFRRNELRNELFSKSYHVSFPIYLVSANYTHRRKSESSCIFSNIFVSVYSWRLHQEITHVPGFTFLSRSPAFPSISAYYDYIEQ